MTPCSPAPRGSRRPRAPARCRRDRAAAFRALAARALRPGRPPGARRMPRLGDAGGDERRRGVSARARSARRRAGGGARPEAPPPPRDARGSQDRARATADLARLAHHAESAGDSDAVLEFAPAAGARASALGAHREAAAQYARALRFADGLPLEERAELLGRHAFECYVTTQDEDALASSREALDVWRQLGEPLRQVEALADVARVALNMGSAQDAAEAARRLPRCSRSCRQGRTSRGLRPDRRRESAVGGPRRDRPVEPARSRPRDTARRSRHRRQRARHPRRRGCAPGTAERRRGARAIARAGAGVASRGRTSSAGPTCSSPWPAAVHGRSI